MPRHHYQDGKKCLPERNSTNKSAHITAAALRSGSVALIGIIHGF
jgi:hypothetical protein